VFGVRIREGLSGIFILCALGAGVWAQSPRATGATPGIGHEDIEAGRSVYNFRCYFCHGYSGDARTLAAEFLSPPPRDFTDTDPEVLSRGEMISAVREGRAGTAMQPFGKTLSSEEIAAVVDFVRSEFMLERRRNTRYHTAENGWENHERFRIAYPFATGEIALDAPAESLDAAQRAGRRLYFTSCVSCHDRARAEDAQPVWEPEALSYPRLGFRPGDAARAPDAWTGATPYARHEVPPRLGTATDAEREGERLFQNNCAFCHAADGTGRNWIGTFLDPNPRDLTDADFMGSLTRERLGEAIRRGVPGTSMPAWGSVLAKHEIEAIVAYIHRVFHPVAD
jgi:cytochrome c oxidase cbb3-type subunit 3